MFVPSTKQIQIENTHLFKTSRSAFLWMILLPGLILWMAAVIFFFLEKKIWIKIDSNRTNRVSLVTHRGDFSSPLHVYWWEGKPGQQFIRMWRSPSLCLLTYSFLSSNQMSFMFLTKHSFNVNIRTKNQFFL